ncbi:TLD-domain-containing protein [Mycena metata]|uniref:Oxidation resistance protein 1 n=1 Tax=Mycena metata TaxID=1033252 RepID=A0AAD7N934_9AGAR|nr:TLD-domain-containing protein [Mycena metata]
MSDSLMDSIPVLIPVSSSSKPSTPAPLPVKTRAELDREAEEAFDKFSTLFSPATPRASPVLGPLFLPERSQEAVHLAPQSPDSEFGSFVSVPAEQDPLSLMTPGLDLGTPMQPQPQPSAARPSHVRTPSQTFFDQFSKSAKDRTETKRGLLDELLMHEDDPLYWIKDQSTSKSSPPSDDDDDLLPSEKPNKYMTDSLSDLDFEFFAAKPHRRSSSTSSHLRSPTRSPTVTAAPTLAPPLASTSTSADAPGFDSFTSSSITSSSAPHKRTSPARSESYASLASISKSSGAKWVASFLPNALSPATASVPNTSMFPPSPTTSPPSSLSSSLVLPPQHNAPVSPPARVEISHFTPFAPAHADGAYVAPSGAPGFRGAAAYDWDRGFSHALERDLGVGASAVGPATSVPYSDFDEGDEMLLGSDGNNAPSRPGSGANGNGNGATARKEGVGVLLEKKMSGVISLVGRREGTVGVLTPELVALIHSHLPALLRLPRQWTLFYSLDQHGISLNTLYSRCAPPSSTRTPHPKGALVVIQDANNVLFGAWVVDGLRRSTRGGYYGGGDSFLWRYVPSSGKFDVYKWTGKNEYVALCEDGFISFGGGDGRYGLYLDDSLFDGSSARCPTFENEPLCSGTAGKGGNVNFECVGLEVWGVGP